MAADVRSLNAQRDRDQRAADNRLLNVIEEIQRRDVPGLTGQTAKRSNRK
ncbi:hypothetical protein ACIBCR_15425 [Micromonospora echinospora]